MCLFSHGLSLTLQNSETVLVSVSVSTVLLLVESLKISVLFYFIFLARGKRWLSPRLLALPFPDQPHTFRNLEITKIKIQTNKKKENDKKKKLGSSQDDIAKNHICSY